MGGRLGVFLAIDLFLFFFFWELMLIPMYLLITVWGHARRRSASFKFFLFTQAGSLLLLVAIIALALLHQDTMGRPSFDYADLMGLTVTNGMAWWLMLAFLIGFAVKLGAPPFHSWLPDTYTEAPTGASIILAGILAKTGAYGLLRFAIPLFPNVMSEFAPIVMGLVWSAFSMARCWHVPKRISNDWSRTAASATWGSSSRRLRRNRAGAARSGNAAGSARVEHRRPLHGGRGAVGTFPDERHAPDGRTVGGDPTPRDDGALLCLRLTRVARLSQFHR